jgi:hypothetical protein
MRLLEVSGDRVSNIALTPTHLYVVPESLTSGWLWTPEVYRYDLSGFDTIGVPAE